MPGLLALHVLSEGAPPARPRRRINAAFPTSLGWVELMRPRSGLPLADRALSPSLSPRTSGGVCCCASPRRGVLRCAALLQRTLQAGPLPSSSCRPRLLRRAGQLRSGPLAPCGLSAAARALRLLLNHPHNRRGGLCLCARLPFLQTRCCLLRCGAARRRRRRCHTRRGLLLTAAVPACLPACLPACPLCPPGTTWSAALVCTRCCTSTWMRRRSWCWSALGQQVRRKKTKGREAGVHRCRPQTRSRGPGEPSRKHPSCPPSLFHPLIPAPTPPPHPQTKHTVVLCASRAGGPLCASSLPPPPP